MTITRLFSCIGLSATFAASAWMSDVHAQQQPAASSSVATSPRASVVTPAHAAPHGHATASSKTPSTSRVKASVAVNATADVEKAQGRYQAPRRDYMDSYRNAVTPPVDSGR